jgi:SAM-dependent methyltransferase
MTGAGITPIRLRELERLSRYLVGRGLEIGPGHQPIPLTLPGTSVRYLDRWAPNENRQLFPELGSAAEFPQPDIVANLDTDHLSALPDESEDFVIASHVLEHVADPIGILIDMHRVLRPGGVALVLLPDRRRTFDSNRAATSMDHLRREHAAGVNCVDDDHIEDFLRGVGQLDQTWSASERSAAFEEHRHRSIHVHCWTQDEFLPVVQYVIKGFGRVWSLEDALFSDDGSKIEFGLVLRKPVAALDPETASIRVLEVWRLLEDRATSARCDRERAEQLASTQDERDGLASRLESAEVAEAQMIMIRTHPLFPFVRSAYRATRRVRRAVPLPSKARSESSELARM